MQERIHKGLHAVQWKAKNISSIQKRTNGRYNKHRKLDKANTRNNKLKKMIKIRFYKVDMSK